MSAQEGDIARMANATPTEDITYVASQSTRIDETLYPDKNLIVGSTERRVRCGNKAPTTTM